MPPGVTMRRYLGNVLDMPPTLTVSRGKGSPQICPLHSEQVLGGHLRDAPYTYSEQILGGRLRYPAFLLLYVCDVVDGRVEAWGVVVDIHDVDDNRREVGELVVKDTVLESVDLRQQQVDHDRLNSW